MRDTGKTESDDDGEPVEYPPSPDAACQHDLRDAQEWVSQLWEFAYKSGFPGFGDKAAKLGRKIKSLTESYLEACADNDRLRRVDEAAREWAEERGNPLERHMADKLVEALRNSETS